MMGYVQETYRVAGGGVEAGHGLAGLVGVKAEGSAGAVPLVPLDVANDLCNQQVVRRFTNNHVDTVRTRPGDARRYPHIKDLRR